jgi:DNA-directed RNA polymerase subunit RPC12/RpoP
MPHSINESHLDDICAQCKKPQGNSIVLENHHHKIYELITCENCGYKTLRLRTEKQFTVKWEMSRK